jgi:hypothetical protein
VSFRCPKDHRPKRNDDFGQQRLVSYKSHARGFEKSDHREEQSQSESNVELIEFRELVEYYLERLTRRLRRNETIQEVDVIQQPICLVVSPRQNSETSTGGAPDLQSIKRERERQRQRETENNVISRSRNRINQSDFYENHNLTVLEIPVG